MFPPQTLPPVGRGTPHALACMQDPASNRDPASISTSYFNPWPVCGPGFYPRFYGKNLTTNDTCKCLFILTLCTLQMFNRHHHQQAVTTSTTISPPPPTSPTVTTKCKSKPTSHDIAVRTAHMCVLMTVHNCGTQYRQSSLVCPRQLSELFCVL